MTAAEVLRRLRQFLLGLSALIFAGTLLELWLVNHMEDAIQWSPFVLAGIGILLIAVFVLSRGALKVSLLRWWMVLVIVGSVFGVYQHVSNNIAFEREIQPNASWRQLMWRGVSGANPFLAPGTLAIAALLSLAGTYKHSITTDPDDR